MERESLWEPYSTKSCEASRDQAPSTRIPLRPQQWGMMRSMQTSGPAHSPVRWCDTRRSPARIIHVRGSADTDTYSTRVGIEEVSHRYQHHGLLPLVVSITHSDDMHARAYHGMCPRERLPASVTLLAHDNQLHHRVNHDASSRSCMNTSASCRYTYKGRLTTIGDNRPTGY